MHRPINTTAYDTAKQGGASTTVRQIECAGLAGLLSPVVALPCVEATSVVVVADAGEAVSGVLLPVALAGSARHTNTLQHSQLHFWAVEHKY